LEQIKISHEKFNEIIFRIFKSDPTFKFDFLWEEMGLNRIDKFKSGGVYFEVVDKTKLVHAMIKYDFTF
jgi:hypothetical protein